MSIRSPHSIFRYCLYLEASASDTPDIQECSFALFVGQRPDQLAQIQQDQIMAFRSRPHGGQESVMVEEQRRITRPFRDAVKQTLDGPHFAVQLSLTISSSSLAHFCFE